MKRFVRAISISLGICLTACVQEGQEKLSEFYPVSYQVLQGWNQENHSQILTVFRQTCRQIRKLPSITYLGGVSGLPGSQTKDWIPVCIAAEQIDIKQPLQVKNFFEQWLQPYQYSYRIQKGKVTGYYEPEIEGSTVKTGNYQVPVYTRPNDLKARKTVDGQIQYGHMQNNQFIPYYTRAEIDRGALNGKNLEIVWLKNSADLFFMQIQGSGRILLPDGKILRLAYAGKNGQPYTPLGKILIDKGYMNSDAINIYSLRTWLFNHPDQALSLMEENKNYVFFKILNNQILDEGPKGAFNVSLSAGRSAAVDKKWIPLGSPLWIETLMPEPGHQDKRSWKHMVFAHDLGGDIHGMNRLDLFTGWGKTAEWYAGLINEKGKIYLLLPRQFSHSNQSVPASVKR